MKIIGIMVIILFKFSLSASQVSQLTIKDGPFLNSIDWYIESTTSYVNSLTFERKIESLNQLGVVTIRFSNFSDSIEEKKSSGPDSGIEFIHHPRFEFEIFIEAEYHIMNYPPSYYFKHKGVLVVIYTGLERFIQFERKNVHEFNKIIKKDKVVNIQVNKEYLIKIDDSYAKGFFATEIGNKE